MCADSPVVFTHLSPYNFSKFTWQRYPNGMQRGAGLLTGAQSLSQFRLILIRRRWLRVPRLHANRPAGRMPTSPVKSSTCKPHGSGETDHVWIDAEWIRSVSPSRTSANRDSLASTPGGTSSSANLSGKYPLAIRSRQYSKWRSFARRILGYSEQLWSYHFTWWISYTEDTPSAVSPRDREHEPAQKNT